MSNFFGLLLLGLIFAGCRNDRPPVVVITPTPGPTVVNTPDIDPAIATALAQITLTPTIAATTEAHEGTPPSTTLTPEFVCKPPDGWVAYTVQQGDTLNTLANVLGIAIDEIKSANCKLDDALAVGQILYLPTQPPIPQPPPVFQQPPPPVNTVQEAPESLAPEIVQELYYFGGGGVPSFLSDRCYLGDEPGLILVSEQNGFMEYNTFTEGFLLELDICDPETVDFSVSLLLPTGEVVPLELSIPPIYNPLPAENAAADLEVVAAVYNLPLAHLYGSYTFVIEDYPAPGMKIERTVEIEKGIPNMSHSFDGTKHTIVIYYFEPNEKGQLAAYVPKDDYNGQAEFLSARPYQVNEDGYLMLEIEAEEFPEGIQFAAYGEKSGFVSSGIGGILFITNQGTTPLCQLSLRPIKTEDWKDYRIRLMAPGDFDSIYVVPGNYDIELKDCAGAVVRAENNVDISQIANMEQP